VASAAIGRSKPVKLGYGENYYGKDFNSMTAADLQRTPLFDLMADYNARMTAFSGWEMPVQFSGLTQEHQVVRSAVGMFDISHMGKFRLYGSDVLGQLQQLVPSDLAKLQPGQAQYTVLLNPQGGIIDDVIFYYQGTESGVQRWMAIVNAATLEKDKTWMLQHFDASQVTLVDESASHALIAIQGPKAVEALQKLVQVDLAPIPAFGHTTATILGAEAFIARTGYTGEDGFEVMIPAGLAVDLWRSLADLGVAPCGLGARDTLRLEAAMSLYGQDINDSTSPLEAGLGWLVHLDKAGDFVGRSILEQQKANGVTKRIVGLQLEGRNIARHDYPVLHEGKEVGIVTSGTLSPTLGYPIALAYVPTELAKIGQVLQVSIRGKAYPATVVKRPFYRSVSK
jgi:aminomethyltransferase